MPERGASPFPTIEADGYRSYSTGMRGKGAEGDSLLVDWERLKEEIKPMQDQLGREHIAFYSQYDPDSDQYTYSPHGLIFSDEAVAQADGKSGLILYEIQNSESKHLNKVVLINAPISRQAIDEMRTWARGGGSSPTQQNARTSFMSNSVDGGSGFDCGDYASWVDGMGCVHDEEIIVTPEEGWIDDPFFNPESLDEEDDSGGFYPPQPDDTECNVAYGCGGGVGPGPVPEPDPCDGDDPPDYCSEPDLCVGDPIPNPEITPSNGWNVKGGMFGPTRNCDSNGLNCDLHDGIDISAEINSPLYSMHPGTVVERRDPPMDPGEYDRRVRTWGNYVIIESEINGEIIRFRYAHLNEMHVPAGTTVYAGQQIGLTGNTGNAQDNGNIVVLPHVHVQARKVVNGHESKVDPNDYMSTKFNNNGTINTSASSCD